MNVDHLNLNNPKLNPNNLFIESVNQISKFAQILQKCSTDLYENWTEEFSQLFQWSNIVEKAVSILEEQSNINNTLKTHLNQKLQEISQEHFEIRGGLNIETLSCARHLMLRTLLFSPCPNKVLLLKIFSGYLQLDPEDVEGVKTQLAADISKRLQTEAIVRVLFTISTDIAKFLFIEEPKKAISTRYFTKSIYIDFKYQIKPSTTTKSAFSNLLFEDLSKIWAFNPSTKKPALQKFLNTLKTNISQTIHQKR